MTDSGVRQRLAATLATDVAGYSRLMTADERATVAAPDTARSVYISVVVPFHNAARHLERCAAGLLGQSYPSSRYEIIMVDNDSTDTRPRSCGGTRRYGFSSSQSGAPTPPGIEAWRRRAGSSPSPTRTASPPPTGSTG